ncbi:flagellin [Albirhodobacter sp. R86504]|uniref:flagellin N-terminal helical domain-containing protein n=1 Tax=Albirhodobacter sp. R86504 TaxID=3093848 RepID=UPI0036729AF3
MSSILTNTSAMVALQTLKGINSSLSMTQSEISTGKSVSSAKDNAAVWSISKVMESDVQGFEGISSSLSLGESTVAVARQAAETVTDLLTEMKGKIVAAQEENVDTAKIQTDIAALRDQIESVVGAAQFNGLNLVDGSSAADVKILSSLDRDSSGNVSARTIDVQRQNLSIGGYTAKAAFTGTTGTSTDADSAALSLSKADTTGVELVLDSSITYAEGDKVSIKLGDKSISYTVTAEDAAQSAAGVTNIIGAGLKSAADALGITDLRVDFAANDGTDETTLTFKVADTDGDSTTSLTQDMNITAQFENVGSGGLGKLAGIDVSTTANAQASLSAIEDLIQTATVAAASFGSAESRIETQSDFISNLTDSMKAGIGSLVDADMEETSARLQALQTQQQLGIQSLSIANQSPQNVLSLFK